jgi:hypothetical protein
MLNGDVRRHGRGFSIDPAGFIVPANAVTTECNIFRPAVIRTFCWSNFRIKNESELTVFIQGFSFAAISRADRSAVTTSPFIAIRLIQRACQPAIRPIRFFPKKSIAKQTLCRLARFISLQNSRRKSVTLSCYNFGKKLPFLSVVLWKFIIEMFLISRCVVLTIRFTVLLQDVTH